MRKRQKVTIPSFGVISEDHQQNKKRGLPIQGLKRQPCWTYGENACRGNRRWENAVRQRHAQLKPRCELLFSVKDGASSLFEVAAETAPIRQAIHKFVDQTPFILITVRDDESLR